MIEPYYADESVHLYHGRAEAVLPELASGGPVADVAVTDPPYGETRHEWDCWPQGWPDLLASVLPASTSLWCFGSLRMFMEHVGEFSAWRMAQESLWLKSNGSGPGSKGRLLRVHEWAVHLYRGRWTDLHHDWPRVPKDHDLDKTVSLRQAGDHRGRYAGRGYVDDGLRLMRSARVYQGPRVLGLHKTEKPLGMVAELVRASVAPGATVLDPFAGSCTTGAAVRQLGDGRRAVLVEADEAMCEKGANRLVAMVPSVSEVGA